MLTRASFRLFRTGLIGSVIVALAAGGHLAGGGRLPEPAIVTALCAVALVPVAVLTRFRLTFPVLAGLLGAGQVWLHWSFSALSAAAPAGLPARMAGTGHPGHANQAVAGVPPEVLDASLAVPGALVPGAGTDAAMFAAHAAATLVTALLLARGERALAALADWFRPLLQRPEPGTVLPARVPGPVPAGTVLPAERAGRRLPARRGPPAPALAPAPSPVPSPVLAPVLVPAA